MRVRELRLTYHPIPGTADIGTGEPLTPASARTLARRCLAGEAQEVFLAILLDAKHRPLAVQIVARGTLSTCEVHPREVLKGAVLANAYAVITAHNHDVPLMNGTTRREPNIWYTLHVQGAGCCIEGRYSYAKGAHKTIREYAPQDTDLHAIADGLLVVQRDYAYSLVARIEHTGRGTHALSTTITVDSDRSSPTEDDQETVASLLRDFMDWIYVALEKEYEYQTSDEVVDALLRDNEYTFTAEGKREG